MFLAVISGISPYRHLLSLFGIHVFCLVPIKIGIIIIIIIIIIIYKVRRQVYLSYYLGLLSKKEPVD